jgi:hypothetical protein
MHPRLATSSPDLILFDMASLTLERLPRYSCTPYCATNLDVMPVPTLSSTLLYAAGLIPPETSFVQRRKDSPGLFKLTFNNWFQAFTRPMDSQSSDPEKTRPMLPRPLDLEYYGAHLHCYPDKDLGGATTQPRFKIATGHSRCRTWEACRILRISSISSMKTSPPMSRHTYPHVL